MVSRLSKAEGGFTVIELMVSSALLLIGLALFTSVLYSVQQVSRRQSELGRANDDARLAFQELDRQVRSGFVVRAVPVPAFGNAADSAIIYTEAWLKNPGDRPQCVAWVLGPPTSGVQVLYERRWNVGTPIPPYPDPGKWRVVAEGITNAVNGVGTDSFVLDGLFTATDPTLTPPNNVVTIGQRLKLTLWFNPSGTSDARDIQLVSSVSSRNAPRALTYSGTPPAPVYNACV